MILTKDIYVECPECGAGNTKPHEWGVTVADSIFALYYPRARDCNACGHLWDETLREGQAQFQNLMLAHVKKDAP